MCIHHCVRQNMHILLCVSMCTAHTLYVNACTTKFVNLPIQLWHIFTTLVCSYASIHDIACLAISMTHKNTWETHQRQNYGEPITCGQSNSSKINFQPIETPKYQLQQMFWLNVPIQKDRTKHLIIYWPTVSALCIFLIHTAVIQKYDHCWTVDTSKIILKSDLSWNIKQRFMVTSY